MKLLLIMRHAKSSWDNSHLDDFERPLNPRGQKDAPRMGTLLKTKKLLPELILASPAVRVKQTLELMTKTCDYQGKIEWIKDYYGATPNDYIAGIQTVPDKVQKVMIVGHNPGMEDLLNQWVPIDEKFPTAAIACLEFDLKSWQDLSLKTPAKLHHLWKPKEI